MMNVSQLRDLTLKLINSFSSDGELIPPSDNADLKLAFNDFLNTAQKKFAEKDKIEGTQIIVQPPLDVGEDATLKLNPLPTDLTEINKVIFLDSYGNRGVFTDYTIENGSIVIDTGYEGTFFIYYYKIPTDLVLDTDTPQIKEQYHNYLAYYCAGEWLMASGQQTDGIVRLNQFDSFLNEIIPNTDDSSNGITNDTGW